VAKIPLGDENIFSMTGPETKQGIFRVLAGTGAKMLVTKNPPPAANNEGWLPLGNTSFYAYPLLPMASSARVEAQTPSGSANSSASSRIDTLSPPRPR
jgi:hypothetical protein